MSFSAAWKSIRIYMRETGITTATGAPLARTAEGREVRARIELAYRNSGYVALGLIVAHVSGKPFRNS
jgi:CubicO group peptidase (beta-lactamase class C family)